VTVQYGDILRVSTRLNVSDTGDVVNVFHYNYLGEGPAPDYQVLGQLAAVMDVLYQTFDQFVTERAVYVDVNVFDVTQARPLGSDPWPTLEYGLAIGDMLPMQTASFVRGLSGYSRNWARKFLGPFAEGANSSNGSVSSTLLGAMGEFGAEWIHGTSLYAEHYEAIVRYKKAETWKPLIAFVVTDVWATVRRRRAGRGA